MDLNKNWTAVFGNSDLLEKSMTKFILAQREAAEKMKKSLSPKTLRLISDSKGEKGVNKFLASLNGCNFSDDDIEFILVHQISVSIVQSVKKTAAGVLDAKVLLKTALYVQTESERKRRVNI